MVKNTKKITWQANPATTVLRGEIRVASDKSISHRAIMFAAMAEGKSFVSNPLLSEDVLATAQAMRALGATVTQTDENLEIIGTPQLTSPSEPIDCGNSGTLIRLITGAICGRNVSCQLVGDSSLNKRPMRRITDPLNEMGAQITPTPTGTPPIQINPVSSLRSIEYTLPVASAQVKSAVLLAGLRATGGAKVIEPIACRDHTEKMLPAFGASCTRNGNQLTVAECSTLKATSLTVPADPSSAAFFMVAASIVEDSELLLREVGINPTRIGCITLLRRMGANIELSNQRTLGNEPVADILVKAASLSAIEISQQDVAAAIDELPVILVAAACAKGTTNLRGAEELRTKESDRISAMASGLSNLGIELEEFPDGITVTGGKLRGGTVDTQADHRIAMAMSVAALRASQIVTISDCANVATSFPNFTELCSEIGWQVAKV